MSGRLHRYWFPAQDLKDRVIDITAEYDSAKWESERRKIWKILGFSEQDLPPAIVVALKREAVGEYTALNSEGRLEYLCRDASRECHTGVWIPNDDFFNNDSESLSQLRNRRKRILKEREDKLKEELERSVDLLMPAHMPPIGPEAFFYLMAVGPSNHVVSALYRKEGNCIDKATLIKGLLGERNQSQIVGFAEIDMDLWARICEEYPAFSIKTNIPTPWIYIGQLLSAGRGVNYEDYRKGRGSFDVRGTIRLNPSYPPLNSHFWVDAYINGKPVMFDTMPTVILNDHTYKSFIDYFIQTGYTCATCEIKENQVVATNPKQ